MLDSARHFQSPEFVKRFIDQLALLKLNTLHWHLTDDQGWRIEIKRYPKLTDVGAWRRPAGAAGTDASGQPVRYGGFYTQDEIRDIVSYAAARYVTIVPEIDMPGHMQAAIAAYPELGSIGDTPVVSPDWGVHTYLVNTDDETIAFLENVLDEVVALFPGPYVHIGGDEAVKDQWRNSPRVQARMRELGIRDENAMQGWFLGKSKNISPRAVAASSAGTKSSKAACRRCDRDVVARRERRRRSRARGPRRRHGARPISISIICRAPPRRATRPPNVRTLADIYAFEPVPSDMTRDVAAHVLGAEAEFWTEHMRTEERVEHAAFPRLDALAEVLWSPAASRNWHRFVERLVAEMARQRALGVRVADSAFRSTSPRLTISRTIASMSCCRSGRISDPLHDRRRRAGCGVTALFVAAAFAVALDVALRRLLQ